MEWEQLTERVGIYQDALHRFSEDSIRLVRFARIRKTDRVLDLGTGNGILAIYAEALYGGVYTGIDTDETAIALAAQSAERNGQNIAFLPIPVENASARFGHGVFDRILMNPPYFTSGDVGARAMQRHGDETLLPDWCRAAFLLLNNGGTLTLCCPAEMMAALFRALDRNRLAPKRMELVRRSETATLALIEAKKLGGDGLRITISE